MSSDVNETIVPAPEQKNIQNTTVESITNSFYGNQFLPVFLKIPQVGHYQDPETKSLRSKMLDGVNETVRGIAMPDRVSPLIPISYFGKNNTHFPGVGDGELGSLSVAFVLDRYMNNYTFLLNWSYMVYDFSSGSQNCKLGLEPDDIYGLIQVSFLDAEEQVTRRIVYQVVVENIPSLQLTVETPEQLNFDVSFRVTNIDLSQFIEGSVLADNRKMV